MVAFELKSSDNTAELCLKMSVNTFQYIFEKNCLIGKPGETPNTTVQMYFFK